MFLVDISQAFVIALVAVFLMELGDKTQLTAFTLGLRFRAPRRVYMGVLLGLFAVTLISVTLGLILKNTVKIEVLKPLIVVLFIFGGIFFLINELSKKENDGIRICAVSLDLCEHPKENCSQMDNCDLYLDSTVRKGAFLKSASFIFFAELGDKTMIMSLGLATSYHPIGVFFGALLALGLVNGVGVFAGDQIANRIPKRTITLVSGTLFILIGVLIAVF